MNTLVLGHGKYYLKKGSSIFCSPIPKEQWINDDYISVDNNVDVEPDIIFDLQKEIWDFAHNNSYDRIIDTTGLFLSDNYKKDSFKIEIKRAFLWERYIL